MFQFNYGNDVYNATRIYASQTQDQRANMMAEVADRWTATNASNSVPRWDGYVKNEIYSLHRGRLVPATEEFDTGLYASAALDAEILCFETPRLLLGSESLRRDGLHGL